MTIAEELSERRKKQAELIAKQEFALGWSGAVDFGDGLLNVQIRNEIYLYFKQYFDQLDVEIALLESLQASE
jgi:hypothetical protein